MTKREIIEDTVAYYSKHPRAKSGSGCYYFLPKNPSCMCAVGRCLSKRVPAVKDMVMEAKTGFTVDEFGHEKNPWTGTVGSLAVRVISLDKALKPAYRGHQTAFWQELQNLHDVDCNWKDGGLTELGEKAVAKLLKEHG